MVLDNIFVFSNSKKFQKIGYQSSNVKNYKGCLNNQDFCLWVPYPESEDKADIQALQLLKEDFSFDFSSSSLIPYCNNLVIFFPKHGKNSDYIMEYFLRELKCHSIHYLSESKCLLSSIIISITIMKSSLDNSLLSSRNVSFWYPNWFDVIPNLTLTAFTYLGERKIYLKCGDEKLKPGKKQIIDTSIPPFESKNVTLIDIVMDEELEWDRFPKVELGEKKNIIVSITPLESRGLYQPENSIRLHYGGDQNFAMAWFLGLVS